MKTILLVEDNAAIRENAMELLELEGYKVISAQNGKIGLQLAKEKQPDIILSDVMMPEMGGYEFFDELKKVEATRNIPFVFITSSVEKKEIQAAMDMGATGYIRKPFETTDLYGTVKRCLDLVSNTGKGRNQELPDSSKAC